MEKIQLEPQIPDFCYTFVGNDLMVIVCFFLLVTLKNLTSWSV